MKTEVDNFNVTCPREKCGNSVDMERRVAELGSKAFTSIQKDAWGQPILFVPCPDMHEVEVPSSLFVNRAILQAAQAAVGFEPDGRLRESEPQEVHAPQF